MKKSLLCLTSVFLLALACPACFPAAAQEAGPAAGAPSRPEAGGPSRMGTGDVKPPVRSEDGVFLRPNMESSVMISDLEQQLLEDQRSGISRTDRRRAREDRARRESYASWENGMIDSNYKQFKGVAEGEKSRHPSSGEKALERIRRIEKMKGDILRFERYYDEDSAEAQSLLSSLEDYYAELEGDTYVANSFAGASLSEAVRH